MTDANQQNDAKDQNVLAFMRELVQLKHGEDVGLEELNNEANKLYDEFGDNLVGYFEPMLSPEQKEQFDKLVEQGADQEGLLGFLLQSIPDLERQIMQVLLEFKAKYLGEDSNQQADQAN